MKLLVSDIQVGKRFRDCSGKYVFNAAVEKLAASFKKDGHKRPIIVRTDGKRPRLVAGARRLAAAKLLGWTHIEAQVLDLTGLPKELADIDAHLVELDDNFPRSRTRRKACLLRKRGKGHVLSIPRD